MLLSCQPTPPAGRVETVIGKRRRYVEAANGELLVDSPWRLCGPLCMSLSLYSTPSAKAICIEGSLCSGSPCVWEILVIKDRA